MRNTVPLIICFLTGLLMIVTFFSGSETMSTLSSELLNWTIIIGGAAFLLGVGSLCQVNLQRISRRTPGWGFSAVLLASFFITLILGCWFGVDATYGTRVGLDDPELKSNLISGLEAWNDGDATEAVSIIGTVLSVSDLAEIERIAGSLADTPAESIHTVEVRRYNPFFFIFRFIYAPMAATMFSLLAFFVASAAYRAFKARTFEAALLLGAAFLVMLGRVPIGEYISPHFTTIAEWIMTVPQTAGQRAIQIGAALGLVSSSLRILLGLEQSYLGQD